MGIACGKMGGGLGMGFQQQSGIKSLLMPLAQRLRSSNDEEVNQFLDEVDKMANERFGDAIKCFEQAIPRGLDKDQQKLAKEQIRRCNILLKEQQRKMS